MKEVYGQKMDEERALYGARGLLVRSCRFEGPADGESALKEGRHVMVEDSYFDLRYPFWHDTDVRILRSQMTESCRAALWYSRDVDIEDTEMHGIKALRECRHVRITGSDIVSPEFGWSVRDLAMEDCSAEGEYFLLRAEHLAIRNLVFSGKYSFQYVKDATLDGCTLHTKDAFWHAKNVTVTDSVLTGEYLGWYSEGLTLIRCKIRGTQPLCYCKNLRLIDCEMTDTDLCFEKSDVDATLTSRVDSIKNPKSGEIRVPSVGEIIFDERWAKGKVLLSE